MLSSELHKRAEEAWRAAMPALGPLGPKLDGEIRAIPGERGRLLALACGTLPISDVASVPLSVIDSYGSHALHLRAHSPFCRDIPEEMFLHFVWYPRINSEALTDCRAFFFAQIAPRVERLDGEAAILAVNRWCAERMTYQLTDGRTESPLTAYRCGTGRCGEESVFLTTALRSVGIPARQVYAPWWAHCDDNHAWVEAWDGERWRFLGACEPEPVLDRGWFCDAAARAPLVHYRTFFDCDFGDPLTERMGSVRLYGVTERYAETFRLKVQVIDASGAPAVGAAVEVDVVNMAAFRPILRMTADARGCVAAKLGRADIHVEAFRDGCIAMADVNPASDVVEICLRLTSPAARSFDSDLTPPPPSGRNRVALNPAQKEERAKVIAACAAARVERAKGWKKPEYEIAEEPWPKFFALAAGNAPELWKFYAAHEGAERGLAAQMLEAMAEKDCRDARFELLEANFRAALRHAEAEHFADAVLNPRIGLEELEDWRSTILAAFPAEQLAEFVAQPEALMEHLRAAYPDPEGKRYPTLTMTPSAALSTKHADEKGRRTLFVAILRALGIPARLNPTDGGATYWRDGNWRPAEAAQVASCRLHLTGDVNLAYGTDWSLSRLEGDGWRTLELQHAAKPYCPELRPGFYRLTTANRLPNGRQLCRTTDFALAEGQALSLPLERRSAPPEQMLSRIPLEDFHLYNDAGEAICASALPREVRLLAWLEPGTEPTEHILNEMIAAANAMKQQMESGVALGFILRERAALENVTLQRTLKVLSRTHVYYDDTAAEELARALFLEPGNLPLAILLDGTNAARFASAGYQVGLVDLMLKLVGCMKSA